MATNSDPNKVHPLFVGQIAADKAAMKPEVSQPRTLKTDLEAILGELDTGYLSQTKARIAAHIADMINSYCVSTKPEAPQLNDDYYWIQHSVSAKIDMALVDKGVVFFFGNSERYTMEDLSDYIVIGQVQQMAVKPEAICKECNSTKNTPNLIPSGHSDYEDTCRNEFHEPEAPQSPSSVCSYAPRYCPGCGRALILSNGAFWCNTADCPSKGPVGFPVTAQSEPEGYDRDRVRELEREIEIEDGNQFKGHHVAQPEPEAVRCPTCKGSKTDKVKGYFSVFIPDSNGAHDCPNGVFHASPSNSVAPIQCTCESHKLAPMYHTPTCAIASAVQREVAPLQADPMLNEMMGLRRKLHSEHFLTKEESNRFDELLNKHVAKFTHFTLAEPKSTIAQPEVSNPASLEAEDEEFNHRWRLASANKVSSYGYSYQSLTPDDSISTGNVGMWYESACYWKKRALDAEAEITRFKAENIALKQDVKIRDDEYEEAIENCRIYHTDYRNELMEPRPAETTNPTPQVDQLVMDAANEIFGNFVEAGRLGVPEWGIMTIAASVQKALVNLSVENQSLIEKLQVLSDNKHYDTCRINNCPECRRIVDESTVASELVVPQRESKDGTISRSSDSGDSYDSLRVMDNQNQQPMAVVAQPTPSKSVAPKCLEDGNVCPCERHGYGFADWDNAKAVQPTPPKNYCVARHGDNRDKEKHLATYVDCREHPTLPQVDPHKFFMESAYACSAKGYFSSEEMEGFATAYAVEEVTRLTAENQRLTLELADSQELVRLLSRAEIAACVEREGLRAELTKLASGEPQGETK